VHLHEVGGLDTIIDVAGTVIGLDLLGVRHIVVAPFPLARGEIETAHGRLPLPSPATLDLLRGAPIAGVEGERETVTPTAAAILTQVANAYGTLPRMTVESVGYGAGRRDDPAPNVLRVIAGRREPAGSALESIVELETNIDDMNPQWYEVLMTRLFDAGALDVTLTPMQMKKNRPAVSLRVLAPVELTAALRTIILNETTTLGVREHPVQRYSLPREIVPIETEFGVIRIKLARRPNNSRTSSPEYDDCARAAREHRVPIAVVLESVQQHAHALLTEEHNAGQQAPPT
jgi:uncharacterized protein (TIGR00299 family) protein